MARRDASGCAVVVMLLASCGVCGRPSQANAVDESDPNRREMQAAIAGNITACIRALKAVSPPARPLPSAVNSSPRPAPPL